MHHDALRSGPQLRAWSTQEWLTADDITGPLVILIHGLAATSAGLKSLATHVAKRYCVAVFDYASFEGIDRGADDLVARLKRFSPALAKHGLALIGHSMGGLVARHFLRFGPDELKAATKGLAALGSPHQAVASAADGRSRKRWLSILIDLMEKDEELDPFARHPACPAAKQLLALDERSLIHQLLDADRAEPPAIPMLTVSGGRNYIELYDSGSWRNRQANRFIQLALSRPNDGLVEEFSADLTKCGVQSNASHCNDYTGWSTTNHTHLVVNQDVADVLLDWLAGSVFPSIQ